MGKRFARVFLWFVVVLAWLLVVVFGAAVFFGPDLLTRAVGLVIAGVALAAALGTQRALRRMRPVHAPHPDEPAPEPLRPPDDLDDGDFSFPGLGPWKEQTALHLDRNGFDAMHLGIETRRYSWSDIEEFRVVTVNVGSGVYGRMRTVGFRLRGRGRSLPDRIARWVGWADMLLPAVAMDPGELAKVLEGYRQRYSVVVYPEA